MLLNGVNIVFVMQLQHTPTAEIIAMAPRLDEVINDVVPVLLGAVPNVTVTPPALYPVPDTSVIAPV